MYITVRFGEKEEAIFNPNCKSISLLTNIKEKCECEEDVELELCDEVGNIKNLRESPMKYANELLNHRERFILLQVDRAEGSDPRFIPLLHDNDFITSTFLAQLASLSSPTRSGGKTTTRGRHSATRRSPGSNNNKNERNNSQAKNATPDKAANSNNNKNPKSISPDGKPSKDSTTNNNSSKKTNKNNSQNSRNKSRNK